MSIICNHTWHPVQRVDALNVGKMCECELAATCWAGPVQTDNMTDKKLRMGVYFTGGTYDGFNWDNNPQSYQYNTTGRM
jgi:hypothetical protein